MVQRHEFENHTEYVDEQVSVTRRKIKSGRANLSTSLECLTAIAEHRRGCVPPIRRGLCHGVRNGDEVDVFKSMLGGEWMGTEITPELCDGKKIVQWDFTKANREWVGRFDTIYSNSFDHCLDPIRTLKIWMKQLSPLGLLYLEHHRYMMHTSRRHKADCLGAKFREYRRFVVDAGGMIETELQVTDPPDRKPNPLTRRVLVVSYCGC